MSAYILVELHRVLKTSQLFQRLSVHIVAKY